MDAKNTLSGGCLCGRFRYLLLEKPIGINDCHCVDCRRASAAAVVRWGTIHAGNFEVVSGELKKVSYADRVRSFATCCGSPIIFQVPQDPEWVDVTIVSLDDPSPYRPEMIIWTEDRLPWVMLDPETPSYAQKKTQCPLVPSCSNVERANHRPGPNPIRIESHDCSAKSAGAS